jgi:hypothetical protein
MSSLSDPVDEGWRTTRGLHSEAPSSGQVEVATFVCWRAGSGGGGGIGRSSRRCTHEGLLYGSVTSDLRRCVSALEGCAPCRRRFPRSSALLAWSSVGASPGVYAAIRPGSDPDGAQGAHRSRRVAAEATSGPRNGRSQCRQVAHRRPAERTRARMGGGRVPHVGPGPEPPQLGVGVEQVSPAHTYAADVIRSTPASAPTWSTRTAMRWRGVAECSRPRRLAALPGRGVRHADRIVRMLRDFGRFTVGQIVAGSNPRITGHDHIEVGWR